MHACIHTYIHAYLHACMHACIHTYIPACMHACMHTYIHTYLHACMHTYIHTYIPACMHACMHACIHTYIHNSMHACMHACIHTYIPAYIPACMHAYIHTYIHKWLVLSWLWLGHCPVAGDSFMASCSRQSQRQPQQKRKPTFVQDDGVLMGCRSFDWMMLLTGSVLQRKSEDIFFLPWNGVPVNVLFYSPFPGFVRCCGEVHSCSRNALQRHKDDFVPLKHLFSSQPLFVCQKHLCNWLAERHWTWHLAVLATPQLTIETIFIFY